MAYDEFVSYAERLLELGVLGFILTGGGEPTVANDFKRNLPMDGKQGNPLRYQH